MTDAAARLDEAIDRARVAGRIEALTSLKSAAFYRRQVAMTLPERDAWDQVIELCQGMAS